ncbi:DUF488 family protein [Streptomyces virginiae]|uniref:DUF488 family protein, N3 subclade n=1 Tax=Streptomyces virginiae TaxID=1961 RepID=UPI00386D02C5|nr:DUF488 family protein [Streptomyces virginiae]
MAAPPLEHTPDHIRARALAQQLRTLREARGWSRERLAKEAGILPRTLARAESGGAIQPGFFTIGALATALEVSLDDLFRPPAPTSGLWSAGYEGRDIGSFVASLVESRINVVADVRLNAISRKPGFSKTRLGQALGEAGIEYTHLRALGNPKDNRAPFWDGRISVGRARFRSLLRTDEAQAALDQLTEQASRSRVAVLCFEEDQSRCHRHVVLTEVRKRIDVPAVPLA